MSVDFQLAVCNLSEEEISSNGCEELRLSRLSVMPRLDSSSFLHYATLFPAFHPTPDAPVLIHSLHGMDV